MKNLKRTKCFSTILLIVLLFTTSNKLTAHLIEKAESVQIWDTMIAFENRIDLQDKKDWKELPQGTEINYISKGEFKISRENC